MTEWGRMQWTSEKSKEETKDILRDDTGSKSLKMKKKNARGNQRFTAEIATAKKEA